mmetsp:Transcript_6678/g.11816  ORF Transcript_6678/g.11816 Transcript_6678/m.11816 type:complete len:106 (+) Transcript_6678:1156-1473(+)
MEEGEKVEGGFGAGLDDMPADTFSPDLLRLLGRHEEADAAEKRLAEQKGSWRPPARSGLDNSDPLVQTGQSSGGATNGTTLTTVTNEERELGATALSGPFVPMGI